jgi:hypothetical protein
MTLPFKPPPTESLASVDSADNVEYETECRIIEGVIAPGGSGWAGREPSYDVHCFSFAAWRFPGQALVGRELVLFRPVPPSAEGVRGASMFGVFPDYSIQRYSALLSKDHRRAVVERVLAVADDPALRQIAERLREPVVVFTEQFGPLVLNPLTRRFEGTVNWNRKIVPLSLVADADGSIAGAVETAARLRADQAAWIRQVDKLAVGKLLPLKNTAWLGPGERKLTPARFTKRKRLLSIAAAGDGGVEFWHDDGEMFLGHAILITGTLADGPLTADIVG